MEYLLRTRHPGAYHPAKNSTLRRVDLVGRLGLDIVVHISATEDPTRPGDLLLASWETGSGDLIYGNRQEIFAVEPTVTPSWMETVT